MATLEAGITNVPLRRRRPALMALATAATAVAGFVVASLVLKSLAHIAVGSLRLVENAFGQSAEYVLVTAISMFAVRKAMNLLRIRYEGRVVFSLFMAISGLVMLFALSSGSMKVDILVSLLRMSALCLFAYLQFWRSDRHADLMNAG
jgi:hypothetical protein